MRAGFIKMTATAAPLFAAMCACGQDAGAQPAGVAAEKLYSEKYSAVVQRLPFGPEPSGFDPDTMVTSSSAKGSELAPGSEEAQLAEEQNALATGVKVGIINVSLDGTAYVGFTDSTVNPPRNYYIRLGDTQGEWTVKGVDGDKREATLKKKDVEVTLKLGGGVGGNAADALKAAPEAATATAAMRAAAMAPAASRPQDGMASARQKLAARRAQREADDAEAKAERAAAEARAAEAMARAEADRAAMREQLSALSESLRQEREERERREREEAEMRMREDAQEEVPEE